jgi:hypothetical protein
MTAMTTVGRLGTAGLPAALRTTVLGCLPAAFPTMLSRARLRRGVLSLLRWCGLERPMVVNVGLRRAGHIGS